LPHLDILGASAGGGLGAEARELIPLLYENPRSCGSASRIRRSACRSRSKTCFAFASRSSEFLAIVCNNLITQRESRKLGRGFDPYQLYKHVSGINAVRLRRLLASLTGEDYPTDPAPAICSCAPQR